MIKKFLKKWGLSASEKEIKMFLDVFSHGDIEQNGIVLGWATLFHYQITTKDIEFEKLLNAKKGENQGPIASYILQLNRLVNELHKAGRFEEAAGMKLWNITFRCMSDDLLHHYGIILWKTASISFSEARNWLEVKLANARESGSEQVISSLIGALKICNFIPPQFCNI